MSQTFLTQSFLVGSAIFSVGSASAASLITAGHVDVIALGYEDDAFEPHVHYEDSAVVDGVSGFDDELEPGEAIIVVPNSTFAFVSGNGGRPAGAAWNPIGVSAGTSYWLLPSTSALSDTLGAPFAGIGMEELDPGDWNGAISLTLTGFSGPGAFSLFTVDGLGNPDFAWSTADGLGDVLTQNAGSHEHYNWTFSAPGMYELTVQFDGVHGTDGSQTATDTFAFAVIPEPSSALLLGLGALATLVRRRR